MGIKELVADNYYDFTAKQGWKLAGYERDIRAKADDFAAQIIPLIRADTLKSISKETKKLDQTTYLVPDYTKFREAIKELGIEE